MKIIHSTPSFLIEAQVTNHPITGKTVELFQTMPQAQHPRAQRIACLTLPQASFSRLAALLTDDGSTGDKEGCEASSDPCGTPAEKSFVAGQREMFNRFVKASQEGKTLAEMDADVALWWWNRY